MRTATCLLIFMFEAVAFYRLLRRYSEHGDVEEFLSNAPLEEIWRASCHGRMAQLALMLATMMRLT